MNKKFILAISVLFCVNKCFAQFQSLAVDYGKMYYIGDIQPSFLPDFQFFNDAWGLNYRFSPGYKFSIGVNYLNGKLHGSDNWNGIEKQRNLDFRTRIHDLSLNMRYYLVLESRKGGYKSRASINETPRARIFFGFGGGAFLFDPEGSRGEGWIPLRDLGTEGQFITSDEYDYPEPYDFYALSLKYSLGVEIKIIENLAVEAFWRFNQTFTDYIDDVSQSYPDAQELVNSTTPLALEMSYKGPGQIPPRGTRRGSRVGNDHFINFGLSLVYRFGFY